MLESPRHAEFNAGLDRNIVEGLSVKTDLTLIRRVRPGDHIEQGGLTGAIRTHQPVNRMCRHVERDVGLPRAARRTTS